MTRIITGLCLTALLAVALYFGGWVFSGIFMATICIAMFEVFRCLKQAGHRPTQWACWLCVAASLVLFNAEKSIINGSVVYLMPLVGFTCMLSAVTVLFRKEPKLEDILVSVMPLVCVLLPAIFSLGSWAAFKFVWNITPETREKVSAFHAAKKTAK